MKSNISEIIESGRSVLGIELGSTRIKSVLIGEDYSPVASGSFTWENRYENGVWTYPLDEVWRGLQACVATLKQDVEEKTNHQLSGIKTIGISGMMHGYLAFDQHDDLLVPFRTWRNTITGEAAEKLTNLFAFNIPQRWSIAHLYQAILNHEPHLREIRYLTTLAGYVHWQLTGNKVLGIGDASGMFPIDSTQNIFDKRMLSQFDALLKTENISWTLEEILPEVLTAGNDAGYLSEAGALRLDPTGSLKAGIPLCPPEGDAGTGMAATNSIAERTGNVSAGTSVFAMLVLDKSLSAVYPEIDMVTTPTGKPVAMVHSNNCTSDLNAWVGLFREFVGLLDVKLSQDELFGMLFRQALDGDPDVAGLLAYNTLSGEPITHLEEGRPLFMRTPESHFTLANFMRVHLFSALAALKIGLDILIDNEQLRINQIFGHGGFFKTEIVGQRMMAAAMNVPVTVISTAGEGGPWGMALLAAYMSQKTGDESLEAFLQEKIFTGLQSTIIAPDQTDVEGFSGFIERYKTCLPVERLAVEKLGK
jgi:sugar (pentulose or hexulose) kinase